MRGIGMSGGDNAEQEEAMLRLRAMTLREIAKDTRVFPDTAAERDLDRIRGEIEEAIVTIEGAEAPYWAIADRLRVVASMLEHLLFMSGINAAAGKPVRELQAKLAAWVEGA
jgi:hypothetical protein